MLRSAAAPVAGGAGPAVKGAGRRPRVYREILLIALCYGAYSVVRNLVPARHPAALELGRDILHLEGTLRIDCELPVNRFFTEERWLAVGANYYYSTLHFVVTIGVLGWLYARHPGRYLVYRRLLLGTTLTALLGFWLFPLAPPRMLPGFVDTVLTFNTWGLYDSSPVAAVSNQYAAMPSLHTAWATWCAIALVHVSRSRLTAVAAIAYPVATVAVILGTANHYVLDAIGGLIALGGGILLVIGTSWAVSRLDPASRLLSP